MNPLRCLLEVKDQLFLAELVPKRFHRLPKCGRHTKAVEGVLMVRLQMLQISLKLSQVLSHTVIISPYIVLLKDVSRGVIFPQLRLRRKFGFPHGRYFLNLKETRP